MTFVKTWPAGAPANSTMTAAEANDLDSKTANAIDKTGDHVTTGHTITWDAGATLVVAGDLQMTGTAEVKNILAALAPGEIDIGDSTAPNAGTLRVTNHSTLQLDSGSTNTLSGTLTISGALAKTVTSAGGRYQLGDNDYPTYSSPRTFPIDIELGSLQWQFPPGWTAGSSAGDGILGTAITTPFKLVLLPYMAQNGKTLSTIALRFTPLSNAGGRTGGTLPTNAPQLVLYRRQIVVGAALPAWTIRASVAYVPISAADYGNGQIKGFSLSPVEAIDTSTYQYALGIIDENGGAAFGDTYHQLLLTYTASDMTPA